MAEFCIKCAHKYGLQPDNKPLFCEGCNTHYEEWNFLKWLSKLFKQ